METLSYARPGTENRGEPWGPVGIGLSRRSVGWVVVCVTAWGWVWWWPGAWVESRRFRVGPDAASSWPPTTFEVTDGGRLVVDRGRLEVWDVRAGIRLADLDGYSVPSTARSGALIGGGREYFRVRPLTSVAEVIDLQGGRVVAEFALPADADRGG
ncbi:MAG TPA: hypothetical protein VEA69_21370 [Tepidisphaeraceae bacterium]|nr:hypothetical protein [Tepidisphaeraceae bacterium]